MNGESLPGSFPLLLVYLCREVLGLPGLGAYLEKKQPQQQAELRGTPSCAREDSEREKQREEWDRF